MFICEVFLLNFSLAQKEFKLFYFLGLNWEDRVRLG